MQASIERQDEKTELEEILSSETFSKSPNLARLLQYVVRRYFEGKAQDLKEYNIGVEALGRQSDFDPTTNSIVRVEVHRLREKLKKYYEGEGANDPIVVWLQPGSYVPQFTRREDIAAVSSEATPLATPATDTLAASGGHGNGAEMLPPESRLDAITLPSRRAARLRSNWLVAVIVALAASSGIVIWKISPKRSRLAITAAPAPSAVSTVGALPQSPDVRILAGYNKENYIDRAGHVWSSDRDFTGGGTLSQPRQFIYRTLDPTLFQTERFGEFSYTIPLKPGSYELRLYFAELNYGPGTLAGGGESSRLFNVTLNGNPLLTNFDVFADAGGNDTADVRTFKDISPAPDGFVHLEFTHGLDDPMVNAIEIMPSVPGKLNPIRLVAQENCFTDSQGRVWTPDDYFSGGRMVIHKGPVGNTRDSDLYDGERFGHFSYAIPAAPGKYTVTLHFAETYFGQQNPGGGGAGSRVFDVYCNGATLLHDFDLFREAGGADRAVDKSFRGIEPNAQGKIVLSFVPVRNYACVNAIEVVSE